LKVGIGEFKLVISVLCQMTPVRLQAVGKSNGTGTGTGTGTGS
jgi:hypothetical protein